MKTLFLLRHAKSSWSEPGLEDRLRPLNKRGRRDAPVMGGRSRQRGDCPEVILSSPALRARQTAQLFAEACAYPVEKINEEPGLYFSARHALEDIIRLQHDRYDSLMMVFHNPGITEFANRFDGGADIDNIPTCGLIKTVCDTPNWQDWSVSGSTLEYFDYPKNNSRVNN